ncbi:hypothetical protein ACIP23_37035, partial [Streptomyces sp. NPDC089733]|uniref:hypothetical protein n=1 Tax=Streptomyces sp. NPDC089733 TaxID=3365918 RepID=UPI0038236A4E
MRSGRISGGLSRSRSSCAVPDAARRRRNRADASHSASRRACSRPLSSGSPIVSGSEGGQERRPRYGRMSGY